MTSFTLVRHSGYAVGGDTRYEGAVEVAEVTSLQAYTVRAAGGTLYPTRIAAEAAATAANRPGPTGLPHAPGYFSSLRVAGAEIHVPGGASA
jgi:hypothetical protein